MDSVGLAHLITEVEYRHCKDGHVNDKYDPLVGMLSRLFHKVTR